MRNVAQPGSALFWGDRGRGFKSRRSDHYLLEKLANFGLVQTSKFLSLGVFGLIFSHILGLKRFGNTIEKAVRRKEDKLYSFDMLGDGAKTRKDAACYFNAYLSDIESLKYQCRKSLWN